MAFKSSILWLMSTLFLPADAVPHFTGYRENYIEDLCLSRESLQYVLEETGPGSVIKIKAATYSTLTNDRNCTIVISPVVGSGVILRIDTIPSLNSQLLSQCSDYIQVFNDGGNLTKLCGFLNESSMFVTKSKIELHYYTSPKKAFIPGVGFVLLATSYKRVFLTETVACAGGSLDIRLSSLSANSSGILRASRNDSSLPGMHCRVTLRPPPSYGVVVSIRAIDLEPFAVSAADCNNNYLQISPTEEAGTIKLCGYSLDEYEFKSFSHWGATQVTFHTSNATLPATKTSFQITFTAARKEGDWSLEEEAVCHNGRRIWKGLACDGHNNCGDLSDEISKEIAQCGAMSALESLAVILSTIIGSLILLVIVIYLRGPKLTEQIERLSREEANRQLNSTESPPERDGGSTSSSQEQDRSSPAPEAAALPAAAGQGRRFAVDYTPELLDLGIGNGVVSEEDPLPGYDEVRGVIVEPISYLEHSATRDAAEVV